MNSATLKVARRQVRKAMGEDASLLIHALVRRQEVLGRGFFGRMKWLLFGR